MTVNYKEYIDDKTKFFEKHDYDYTSETSPMDENGTYYKTYSFTDNAQWCERMSVEFCKAEAEVKLCKITMDVKMFKVEFWSSESESKYYYEKF